MTSTLEANLKRIRRRYAARVFLRWFASGVTVGLILGALASLAAALLGSPLVTLPLLGSLLLAALLTALLATLLRTPGLSGMARLLERRDRDLRERLSTALEVSALRTAHAAEDVGPVASALVVDATERSSHLDAAGAAATQRPRPSTWLALAGSCVLFTAATVAAPVLGETFRPVNALTGPTLGTDEQAELAGGLRRVAELFEERAEQEQDAYLRAIGRQLQELSAELETSADIDLDELTSQLERLLEHTRAATRDDATGDGGELADLLEAALRELDSRQETPLAGAVPEEPMPGEALSEAPQPPDGSELPPFSTTFSEADSSAEPSLFDLLGGDAPEDDGHGDAETGRNQSGARGDSYFSVASPDAQMIAELNERARAAQEAMGEMVGASADASEGPSSVGGQGSEDLFGDEADRFGIGSVEQLEIPEEFDPDGRHVRIEVTPEASETTVLATPLGDVAWTPAAEASVSREPLTALQRATVSRFHTPDQSQQ